MFYGAVKNFNAKIVTLVKRNGVNMKFAVWSLLIICNIFFFTSCSDNKNGNENLDVLTFEQVQIGKTIEDCDTSKDCTSIYFYYPVFNNDLNNPVIDKINNFIMSRLLFDDAELDGTANLDTIINNFIEDYKMQVSDYPEYNIPWYSKTEASAEFQNKDYLTLKISNESYTGGAHPNSFINYFVISKATGKDISLKELFKPGFTKELNNIAAKEFRKVRGITSNNSLTEEGFWFENNQNIFNNNFGLTEKGILFYYNAYDVAPYAYGPTIVEIPYSEIDNIMDL